MGPGSGGGAVWIPLLSYPGVNLPWSEVLLFGPLGQVGELLAALGQWLQLALSELREVTAAGETHGSEVGAGVGGGSSLERLAEVAQEGLLFAQQCLCKLNSQLFFRKALESAAAQGGSGGQEAAAASSGAPAGPLGAKETGRYAVRCSYAAAELLPSLSLGVQMCARLLRETTRAGGNERARVARMTTWVVRLPASSTPSPRTPTMPFSAHGLPASSLHLGGSRSARHCWRGFREYCSQAVAAAAAAERTANGAARGGCGALCGGGGAGHAGMAGRHAEAIAQGAA